MEYNQNANIQKFFFSKDTISEINKILLQNFNSSNIDRNVKEEIIKLIIKNMKIVYRSIDTNKINANNQKYIYEQFKKQSIVLTFSDVKNLFKSNVDNSNSDIKYQRDFNSVITPGNKIMERSVDKNKLDKPDIISTRKKTVNNSDLSDYSSNKDYNASFSSELDNVFKPLVQTNDNNLFNNYNFDNKSIDISNKMDEIKKMRQSEIITNKPPEIPDFLKSVNTSNKTPQNNNMNQSNNNSKMPDFLKSTNTSNQSNNLTNNQEIDDYTNLVNDTSDDLFSIDNIDKPITITNIEEDNSSFDDRLKKLYNSRNNIEIPPNNNNIDFTSENFKPTFTNNTVEKKSIKLENNQMMNNNNQIMSNQKSNQNSNQSNQNSNNQLNNNKEKLLNDKLNEYDAKIKLFMMRENELKNREIELNNQFTKLDILNKRRQCQLDISTTELKNIEDKSDYVYKLPQGINNIISIKLMSYSLPLPRYNIITNINDKLLFNINDTDISIIIPNGKYSIEELLNIININLLKNEKTNNIKFKINYEQKIIIESESNFNLIETSLLKENLGFISECKNNNNYISDNIWDLRIEDKVYLYLNNISDENPLGVLYFANQTTCQFSFKEHLDINTLHIKFKDSKGNNYNFNNLHHSLSFVIETSSIF